MMLRQSTITPYLFCVLGWLFVVNPIHMQTYFSKAYDIDLCLNEAGIVGQISENTGIVSGIMQCSTPYFFRGYAAFEFDMFDGSLVGQHTNERFNIWNKRAGIVGDNYLMGGTGSFVPEKGIWKVDAVGNVLDSVLFNHPDEFNYAVGLGEYQKGYVVTIVYDNVTKYDLVQLEVLLDRL